MGKYRLMGTVFDVEAEQFAHGAPGTPRQQGIAAMLGAGLQPTGHFQFRDPDDAPAVPIRLGDWIVRPPNGVPYVLNPIAFHSLFVQVLESEKGGG